MAYQRFNHKYKHCKAINCQNHDCIHYMAYLEAIEQNIPNIETVDHCQDVEINYVRVRIEK